MRAIDAWRADFKNYLDHLDLLRDDYNGIIEYIDEAPSAQAEIIRCKDCRYKELKGVDYFCDHITGEEIMVSPNEYCSWAERGTDG